MRLAASIGSGGGGGLLLGCDGTGLRCKEGGKDAPDAGAVVSTGGGVSRRVLANKSKSAKSRMAALGAESKKSDRPGASGGDVETGASFSCVAILPGLLVGAAIARATLSSVGGVWIEWSGFFTFEGGGCSDLDPPTRSSCLLHLSCRYTARHFSMIALVLSTLKGIFIGASLPASLPFPRTTTRSFTVKQHMQRNLSSSLGTRTRLSQHMHLRISLPSSSSPGPSCFFFPLMTLPGGRGRVPSGWSSTGTSASSTSPSAAPTVPRFPVLLLRPNNFGNG
jgi:hypothetical protein